VSLPGERGFNQIFEPVASPPQRMLRRDDRIADGAGDARFLDPRRAFLFGATVGRRFAGPTSDELDVRVPGLPKPIAVAALAVEPVLEATAPTRWLARTHFITARA